MEEIAKGKSLGAKNVKKILEQTKQNYGNRPLSEQQEEAIVLLVNANDSSSFKGENRIIKAINKIASPLDSRRTSSLVRRGCSSLPRSSRKPQRVWRQRWP